jgi:isoquinoline 1-oxidoreductase subunit beta
VTMGKLATFTRRAFLASVAAAAGGFAVGYYYYSKQVPNPLLDGLARDESSFNPYVKIDAKGRIAIIVPRAEMGQGISTTLAAMVAEELDVSLDMLTVEHGRASKAYGNDAAMKEAAPYPDFDHSFGANTFRAFGHIASRMLAIQATGGSASTYDHFGKMRQAGASAREMLKSAAAAKFGVAAAALTTADGKVTDPVSGQSLTYGELAEDAARLAPPSDVALRDPSTWNILGRPQKRVDMLAKVTGAAIFGIDVALPNMVYATVRMNPHLGGAMTTFDATAAKQVKGVQDVIALKTQTGQGFAVIASNTWSAFKGADAVKAEWGEAPYAATSDVLQKQLTTALATGAVSNMRSVGDADQQFADSNGKLEAEYYVPYLAHACMEPMNATAFFDAGELDIWSPNQAPTIVQSVCASAAGIETAKVRVHTTHLGGGFGRRAEIDFSLYATLVAMQTSGKPVKVTWTREEDMTHDTYRPASAAKFRAMLHPDTGLPYVVEGRVAAPSIIRSVLGRTFPSMSPMGPDRSIVDGSFNQPYDIANFKLDAVEADIKVPVGFWRSVGNSSNGFFHESFMDEIAFAGKTDPVELRLKLMDAYPSAKGVVMKVAEMSSWTVPKQAGRAKGLAFTDSFGTAVAMVIEVSDTSAGIKLENVWAAVDVGRALDPEIIKAQVSSAVIYGLSAAMNQEITFADGMVEQRNFTDYDAMRIWQCPAFEVAILETKEELGGVGEPGLPPAAPALANAIFALTGRRIRNLPLSREVQFA